MMKGAWVVLYSFVALVLLHTVAPVARGEEYSHGSRITLTSTTTISVVDRGMDLTLEVANSGNTTARGVHPEVRFRDYHRYLDKRDISPGEVVTFRLEERDFIGNWLMKPGSYAVRIYIHYLDAAETKHISAAHGQLLYGVGASDRQLQISAEPVTIHEKTTVPISVHNTGTKEVNASLSVFSGEGLQFFPQKQALTIPAAGTSRVSVRAENPLKVERTTLPAFLVVVYQQGGLTFTEVGEVSLSLRSPEVLRDPAEHYSRIPVVILIFFLCLVVVILHGLWSRPKSMYTSRH